LLGNIFIVFQIAALYLLLDKDLFVEYRVIINTANYAAIILTMGLVDSAHFAINKRKIEESKYLGVSLIIILSVYVISLILFYVFSSSELTKNLFFGIALGFIISIYLLFISMLRVRGEIDEFFKEINLKQRVIRTFLIVGALAITNNIESWYFLVFFGYLTHLLFVKFRNKIQISISSDFYLPIIKSSFLFFIVSLLIISITRAPYYYSLYLYDTSKILVIDIVLTAMVLMLIPFLNQYKISEISSNFRIKDYINDTKVHYPERLKQHGFLVAALTFLVIFSEFVAPSFLENGLIVAGILMIGMTVIVSSQHYLAMLQLTSNRKMLTWSFFSILIFVFLITMILKSYRFNYNVELSFVVLSVAYALIGKIVWNSIAKDSSEKFFDIKFFIVGIIPAIFLIGFGLI